MKVLINSVHFKADQKLEDFITQKVEKLCAKYSEVISEQDCRHSSRPSRRRPLRQQTKQVVRGIRRRLHRRSEEATREIQGQNRQVSLCR